MHFWAPRRGVYFVFAPSNLRKRVPFLTCPCFKTFFSEFLNLAKRISDKGGDGHYFLLLFVDKYLTLFSEKSKLESVASQLENAVFKCFKIFKRVQFTKNL